MITIKNEFETVPAFTNVAGMSNGEQSARSTTAEMIDVFAMIDSGESSLEIKRLWRQLAKMDDDETDYMLQTQQGIAEELNYYMPLPAYCRVELQDNEWTVTPYIDEELKRVSDVPDAYEGDHILEVSNHEILHIRVGNRRIPVTQNVTCYEWDINRLEYKSIWALV